MRQFTRALAALACAGAFATAAHSQTVNLKMQASWPAALTLYDNFKYFADQTGKLSGGTLKIETMPGGQVVPPFEVLDATHKKVIDGHHSWAGYWVGKHKAGILFTGGPGALGMDFVDQMGWLHEGGGMELYQEYYRDVLKLNVVPFPVLPAGPQAFGWFKRPIKSLADLKGLKCRQTGMAAEVWNRMGIATVNMPGGEIMPAAQRGAIDCAEWVGGVEDLRFGFHNVWKYHYVPGIHENVSVGEVVFNGDVWKALSPVHQDIVKAVATETLYRWWAKWQKQNADALKEMREKHGVQVLRTPPDILMAFLKTWDTIAAEESAKDPFFKKVYDSQKAYASIVVPSKRFNFMPYSFVANHYWPEAVAKPAEKGAAKK